MWAIPSFICLFSVFGNQFSKKKQPPPIKIILGNHSKYLF